MDLGGVALIAVVAGLAGGTVGAALVGTVEGMLRQRRTRTDRGVRRYRTGAVPKDRLDVDSRKVVTLAQQEAIQSGHSSIGSENLAMALRLYSTPTLDRIWRELGIDSDVLRRRIEAAVPPTLGVFPTGGSWPERVTKIVRMAHAIAEERQREEVAPEHLLIALVVEGGGAGANVLASLGATPQRIREIVDGPTV